MKPHTKLRALLVHPKDKTDPKEGVLYNRLHRMRAKICRGNKEKITSESERTPIRDRKSKQRKNTTQETRKKLSQTEMWGSAITDHAMQENHLIDWESARIIEKERDDKARGIKEAVHVRILPNMNRDEGRFHLSHLYDDPPWCCCTHLGGRGAYHFHVTVHCTIA